MDAIATRPAASTTEPAGPTPKGWWRRRRARASRRRDDVSRDDGSWWAAVVEWLGDRDWDFDD